jgi:hypothetical protein
MASELLDAIITCPACGYQQIVTMEAFAQRTLWPCPACGSTLRPRPGEHCIYCSFASLPCPSVQRVALAEQQIEANELADEEK